VTLLNDVLKPQNQAQREIMEYYQDRMSGKWSQLQLEEACHFWTALHALSEMVWQSPPTVPAELLKWRDLSDAKKKLVDEDVKSRMREMVSGFYTKHNYVVNRNRVNLEYLLGVASTMRKYNNISKLEQVQEVINGLKIRGVKPWSESLQGVL
jgi:hypothetical protein